MSYIGEVLEKLKTNSLTGYRVNIYAGKGICIEGHEGLIYVSLDNIKVRVKHNSIDIVGEDLKIAYMSTDELIIAGTIKDISL